MKNKELLVLAILIVIVSIFTSCKKSDNDPMLPFNTRDGRITNSWKLTKLNKIITTVNSLGITDTKIYSFDGTNMVYEHEDYYGTKIEETYSYSDQLVISKDNLYTQVVTQGDNSTKTQAFWYWHDATKSKIGISFDNGIIYLIKRLARKELILEYSKNIEQTNSNGEKTMIINSEILTYKAE